MPLVNQTKIWESLHQHYQSLANVHLSSLFQDPSGQRFNQFAQQIGPLIVDYSKNHIINQTLNLLIELANTVNLSQWIEKLFTGGMCNFTEKKAALHTALRNRSNAPVLVDGRDIMPAINEELRRISALCQLNDNEQWLSASNHAFTDVVVLGIGGSELGPRLATEALAPFAINTLGIHFVSNLDGTHIAETLRRLIPQHTAFIIASKTFTTEETLKNAETARSWLSNAFPNETDQLKHFLAVTANPEQAQRYGIPAAQIYRFWDWVGGRFSLWSSIGLPIALSLGMENFEMLLSGAHTIDKHFRHAELKENVPVILGLLGVWYNNFFKAPCHAIIPYDQYLKTLPNYLQQLDMESNGKQINYFGNQVQYATSPVILGGVGTDSQHAMHQYFLQGTQLVPTDFILPLRSHNPLPGHHQKLIAHCLAQSRALMCGRTEKEAQAALAKKGYSKEDIQRLAPHQTIPGNRPSTTIVVDQITPYSLGALLALYEHKSFTQSIIWEINAFDQWGVELGKSIAHEIQQVLNDPTQPLDYFDNSTSNLIRLAQTQMYHLKD